MIGLGIVVDRGRVVGCIQTGKGNSDEVGSKEVSYMMAETAEY